MGNQSKLFWINEVDGGEVNRYLGDKQSLSYCKGCKSEAATLENTTLDDLAEYCDSEAENANYHKFCGVHEKLAKLLTSKSSETAAKEIMFVIAEAGGLHEYAD